MISYASIGLALAVLLAVVGIRIGRRGRPVAGPFPIDAPVRWRPPDDGGAATIELAPPEPGRPEAAESPGPRVETAVVRARRPGVANSRFGRGPGEPIRAATAARVRPGAGQRPAAGSHRR